MASLVNVVVIYFVCLIYIFFYVSPHAFRTFTNDDLRGYRQKVVEMFHHAYESYLNNAFPFDELKPLSCHGIDTWGSFSLTLIDALDTLAVMHNFSEFRRVVSQLVSTADFNININVSVFETNIRVVGGLISAHLLSHKAGVQLEPGWPCSGPLLELAEAVARRLLPAFNTKTGMPYGTVNLRHGVPPGETPITCTAGVSTFILEFGTLSRLTGDPIFEQVAQRALYALWERRSHVGLVGNHINVQEGKWTAMDAGIGGGVDSYYEYLLKGAILFQDVKLMRMFKEYKKAITKYMKRDDWYFWVSMGSGQVTMPVFQSLESFWPGLLSLVGDNDQALKTLYNYHQVWKQYGFTPEFYDVSHSYVKREGYPLRPELIESIMYLYRATKDPSLLEFGVDILESIEYSARTDCGYATIKSVVDHGIEDRMESFFLAETTKYLYLLFDPTNFIHNNGTCGEIIRTTGGDCFLGTGGYVFNTEAHPIDTAAVYCCSSDQKEHDALLQNFQKTMNLHVLLNINERGDFLHIFKQNQKKKRLMKSKTAEIIDDIDTDMKIKTFTFETQYLNETVVDITNIVDSQTKYSQKELSVENDSPNSSIDLDTSNQKQISTDALFVNFVQSSDVNADIKEDSQSSGNNPSYIPSYTLLADGDNDYSYHAVSDMYEHANAFEEMERELDEKLASRPLLDFHPQKSTSNDGIPHFNKDTIVADEKLNNVEVDKNDLNTDESRNKKVDFKGSAKFYAKSVHVIPTIHFSQLISAKLNVSTQKSEEMDDYSILSCPAQPFISRLSLMGQIMNTDL